MTHGALFNGIAGFPLAAAWAGIDTEWTVEIDEFCNKISKKHFPNATQYTDIRECKNLPYVDIISGGFPCQPFSTAGLKKGQEDDRALWPEMLRIIDEVKPTYVIGENVTGIINLALDEVLSSLEIKGYTSETFVLPACSVDAPHRRNRVWIIAYSTDSRCEHERLLIRRSKETIPVSETTEFSHTSQNRSTFKSIRTTKPAVCSGDNGLPTGLGRDRARQLKAYGNAIVPQVAYEIFKAIKIINHGQAQN